jgi:opacity protein-like surface antigen
MKRKSNLILCFVALATLCAASCETDNDGDNNGNNGNNGYSAEMIVGTWQVDNMTVDGQDMTPENVIFIMEEDGTGLANDNGVTENNGFTWSVNGDQLTITPRSGMHFEYTINSLTENECIFSGDNVPMTDIPGNVVVRLVRMI